MPQPRRQSTSIVLIAALFLAACARETPPEIDSDSGTAEVRPDIYAEFTLTADLSHLSERQKTMVGILIDASEIMDDLFWRQAWADDYRERLEAIDDPEARRFAEINYGPWDRLDENRPFLRGVGPKPLGANFYPPDMEIDEFEAVYLPGKAGL